MASRSGRVVRADDARLTSIWTPDKIIAALQDYERLYGNSTAASFAISAAKWQGRPELRERYIVGNPLNGGAPWPSLNTIKRRFNGSFDEARLAAGLKPNKAGPGQRRANGQAPILDIRDRLVVLPPERAVVLTKQLDANKRMLERSRAHAKRLEAELERSRAYSQRTREINGQLTEANRKLRARIKKLRDQSSQ